MIVLLSNVSCCGPFTPRPAYHSCAARAVVRFLQGRALPGTFLAKGRRGIAYVPRIYFYVVGLGAVLVLVSLLLLILAATDVELPTYAYELMVNYIATPALIPCCHMLAERAFATRCNVADSMPGQWSPPERASAARRTSLTRQLHVRVSTQ